MVNQTQFDATFCSWPKVSTLQSSVVIRGDRREDTILAMTTSMYIDDVKINFSQEKSRILPLWNIPCVECSAGSIHPLNVKFTANLLWKVHLGFRLLTINQKINVIFFVISVFSWQLFKNSPFLICRSCRCLWLTWCGSFS